MIATDSAPISLDVTKKLFESDFMKPSFWFCQQQNPAIMAGTAGNINRT
jgi:hypothetical protein